MDLLPAYQSPACSLDDSSREALADLLVEPATNSYQPTLRDCARQLGFGASDLQERLRVRLDRRLLLLQRRQEKAGPKTAEEERLDDHLAVFEKEVEELTSLSEEAIRRIVDRKAELDREASLLNDLYAAATARQPDSRVADVDSKEGITAPVSSTVDAFRQRRSHDRSEYEGMSPYERYANDQDYASFKKLWHDAAAGEDGPPLPDASRWFGPDGKPVMKCSRTHPGRHDTGAAQDIEDDGDDDVAVSREVLSINCPLTLRPMKEPYSNTKCKHTFEKAAILDYLPPNGQIQCPQTGCSQV